MSDLFSYLDVHGPEYSYLGHFRCSEYLEAGHNSSMGMEMQGAGQSQFQQGDLDDWSMENQGNPESGLRPSSTRLLNMKRSNDNTTGPHGVP